jgi:hypothetical protein
MTIFLFVLILFVLLFILLLIIVTIIMGQLTSQVNAAVCMIDFLNNYFMLLTIYVSLFIEMTGLVHSVYLVQMFFSKITGKPIESKEVSALKLAHIIDGLHFHCLTFLFCSLLKVASSWFSSGSVCCYLC